MRSDITYWSKGCLTCATYGKGWTVHPPLTPIPGSGPLWLQRNCDASRDTLRKALVFADSDQVASMIDQRLSENTSPTATRPTGDTKECIRNQSMFVYIWSDRIDAIEFPNSTKCNQYVVVFMDYIWPYGHWTKTALIVPVLPLPGLISLWVCISTRGL